MASRCLILALSVQVLRYIELLKYLNVRLVRKADMRTTRRSSRRTLIRAKRSSQSSSACQSLGTFQSTKVRNSPGNFLCWQRPSGAERSTAAVAILLHKWSKGLMSRIDQRIETRSGWLTSESCLPGRHSIHSPRNVVRNGGGGLARLSCWGELFLSLSKSP